MRKRRRINVVLNVLAVNILFFALYLNFIYKEGATEVQVAKPAPSQQTTLIQNPDQYLKKDYRKYNERISVANQYN